MSQRNHKGKNTSDNDEESTVLIVLIPLLYCYPLLFKSLLYNHFAFTCLSHWKESQRGFSLLPKKKKRKITITFSTYFAASHQQPL